MKKRTGFGWIVLAAALLAACSGEKESGVENTTEISSSEVAYEHDGVALEGFLAEPGGDAKDLPGVLIVHAWKGIGAHERDRAQALAELGYVAFACDIYGKGIRPTTTQEAGEQAGKYRSDRALLRARARAGLDWLKSNGRVDAGRVAAIGFCFGGGTVLELARSGADLLGVVSFHGNLDTPDPADAANIRSRVLVLHGADDPHVPAEQVRAFEEEMEAARVNWRFVAYDGAVHAFTDPNAGDDPSRGAAYDEKAAAESWAEMLKFFGEMGM